jgi:toxin ParE1/3/4
VIVEFQPAAEHELVEATQRYLDDGGPPIAEQFESALNSAVQLLAFMPKLGKPGFSGTRLWPLKHFPYTLVYRVTGEVLSIVAVAHQSRVPGYWQGR